MQQTQKPGDLDTSEQPLILPTVESENQGSQEVFADA